MEFSFVFKLRVIISSIPIVAGFLSSGSICWMQHLLAASTPSFAAFNPRSNCFTLSFGWRSLKPQFTLNYSSIPIYHRHILSYFSSQFFFESISWSGWWFQTFFIFPYIGYNTPIWLSYFSEGWLNHQPVMVGTKIRSACLAMTSCSAATLGNRTYLCRGGREGTGLKKQMGVAHDFVHLKHMGH